MTTANQFVDCSSNNAWPNLAAYAKAGHKHICRKVSEGVGYRWHEGDSIPTQAHYLGLHVGNYHWLRPDSNATAQAAFFVAAVKPSLKPGDWLMTDFERTEGVPDPGDAARAAQLREFNAYVREHLPTYPLHVYTGNWYLDGKPSMQAEARKWPIVMSDYSGATALPNPYHLNYVAWQFTDRATVAGFAGHVDYNRWLVPPTTGGLSMSDVTTILAKLTELEAQNADLKKQLAEVQSYFVDEGYHRTVAATIVRRLTTGKGYLHTRKLP